MLGDLPVTDGTEAEFASTFYAGLGHQFVAANGFGARKQGPERMGLVFRLQQSCVFADAVRKMLVTEGSGRGDAAEFKSIVISGAGGDALFVDIGLELFWAFQPAARHLQGPVGVGI